MRFLRTISLIAITLSISWSARAQKLDADYYTYPLLNTKRYYSSNFGELRTNHFHSGVDMKTDGVEGKTVVAAADGYISRIFLSPWGFGLALYITHPNGTTTVYGHLQKFRDDIAAYVYRERHRLKQHRVDLYCNSTTFPVKKGEMIALSGNSGSSGGPHLHFEIRETATQKTLNMFAQGIYVPEDNIAPLIQKIHYFEVDTIGGVPLHSNKKSYDLSKDGTLYSLKQTTPMMVGRRGYFVVEVSDRKNNTQNRYGVYNISAQIDGRTFYEYRNDGYTFDITRYCNAIAYYPIQRTSKNEVIRLARIENCIGYFYPQILNNGLITTKQGERRKIRISATDDCLNTATLEFEIEGKADSECFKGSTPNKESLALYNKPFKATYSDDFTVEIPANALYESTVIEVKEFKQEIKTSITRPLLSTAYTVGSKDIPLHKAMTVSFKTSLLGVLDKQLVIARVSDKNEMLYVGGKYKDGVISVSTTTMGTYCVTYDVTDPQISPKFSNGENMSGKKKLQFKLSDNFSGVDKYSATIDGKWVAIDYANGVASINLVDEGIKGDTTHEVIFNISDVCGNKASWKGTFKR